MYYQNMLIAKFIYCGIYNMFKIPKPWYCLYVIRSFFLLMGWTACVLFCWCVCRTNESRSECISTSAHNQRCIIGSGFQTLIGLVFCLWGMQSLTAESYNCSDVIHLKVQSGPFSSLEGAVGTVLPWQSRPGVSGKPLCHFLGVILK